MKNNLHRAFLCLILVSIFVSLKAQSPNTFRYQAVVRNASGNVLQTQNVSLKISLLQTNATGTVVYSEEHAVSTNTFGLVNLEIGNGSNTTGLFSSIDWAAGPYFIKIELDATGGNAFVEMGTTQLLSVPYALYAASGNQGPQGLQGEQGPAGQNGQDGQPGADGIGITNSYVQNDSLYIVLSNAQVLNAGHVRGAQGIQGIQGVQGEQGIQGLPGTNGTNGISITNTYVNNDSLYITLSDNTSINAGHVRGAQGIQGIQGIAGPQGEQGTAGTGLNNRGAWASGTDYISGDYVFDRSTNDPLVNSMWICQTATSFTSNTQPYQDATNWVEFQAPAGPQGIQGIQGEQGPQGLQGAQGPAGINGIDGINGTNGIDGINGIDGKTVLNGTTDPTTEGTDGDFYINTSTNMIFGPKTSGAWGSGTSLIGPQGQQGIPGIQGVQGVQGEQGIAGTNGANGLNGIDGKTVLNGTTDPTTEGTDGDFYINTSTNMIFGPKTSGAWGSGTSLVGPQGEQGVQGIQGAAGTGLTNRGNWLTGTEYNPGDYVFDRSTNDPLVNSMWISENTNSFTSTTQPYLDAANWVEFQAPAGPQGEQGIQGIQGIQGPAGTNGTNGISISWQGTLTAAPGSPTLNMAYYNSTDKKSYIYNGSTWNVMTQDGATGATGATGAQGPQGLQGIQGIQGPAGTNGTNGISISWQGTLATAPGSPTLNMAYYNSTDKKSYIYNGSTWTIISQDGATGATGAQGIQGLQGLQGIQGPAGTNGTNGISISWQGTLTSAPGSPTLNMAYYNSTDKKSYIYNGSTWNVITQDGATGATGAQGPQGEQGPAGTYTAGTGIDLSSGIITNTSPNATHTGDATGSTNLTVVKLQGRDISSTAPANGQALKWNSVTSKWEPSADNSNTYLPGTGLTLAGSTFNSVWTASGLNIYSNNLNFVGIGTTNPLAKLHVDGSFRLNDDTEGLGKVLTSDAFGNASWQSIVMPSLSGSLNFIPKFTGLTSIGNSIIYENNDKIGIGTITPSGRVEIQADLNGLATEPLFQIKDKYGFPVMIVYEDSVRFFVNDDPSKAENRGAFAVSGKNSTKAFTNDIFVVNPDSTRVYTNSQNSGFSVSNSDGTASYMNMSPDNYFIGHQAGQNNQPNPPYDGMYNLFLGYQGGFSNTSGGSNIFMGYQSGYSNISGGDNVFLGNNSGYSNTTGVRNVFIGSEAGKNNTNGGFNVFIGDMCGYNNIGGTNNEGSYNVFLGWQTGFSNTVGYFNTFSGYRAGYSNSSGNGNSFYGYNCGYWNENGYNNLFMGFECGYMNVSGSNNAYAGHSCGYYNSTGSSNAFFGNQSGFNNTTGSDNVFMGKEAGYSNTEGFSNVFIGTAAGKSHTTGWSNTILGDHAGYGLTTGTNNILIGNNSGYKNAEANGNIFIGRDAGYENLTGYGNLAIGNLAGNLNTTGNNVVYLGYAAGKSSNGSNNVYVGPGAGESNASGENNVFIGGSAGKLSTGSSNVFIGYLAGYDETGSNKLFIDNLSTSTPLIWGDFLNDIAAINGSLGVGTQAPDYKLTVQSVNNNLLHLMGNGTYGEGAVFSFGDGGYVTISEDSDDNLKLFTQNGRISLMSNSVGIGTLTPGQKLDIVAGNARVESGFNWLTNSDIRYKKNVSTLVNSLDKILNIRGVRYDLIKDENIKEGYGKQIGFIAQELEKEFPEFVVTEDNGYKCVAYDKMTAVLVEAVKELSGKVDLLTKENIALKIQSKEIEMLKAEIDKIKSILNTSAKK